MITIKNQHLSELVLKTFQTCSDQAFNSFFNSGVIQSFPKGTYLYQQGGAAPSHIYFLLSGMVKICTSNQNDQTMIKDIIYPGSFFSETALFGPNKNDETAISIENDTKALVIQARAFESVCQNHPIILSVLLDEIGKKLIRKEEKLASFHFNNAKSRIIHFLKETAEKVGTKVGYETLIKHSFTQQDIANITGTSRQTVTFVMNSLKKENIIHFDRKRILIRDLDLL